MINNLRLSGFELYSRWVLLKTTVEGVIVINDPKSNKVLNVINS